MQRTAAENNRLKAIQDAKLLIADLRNQINAYLGRRRHDVDVNEGYVYRDDPSSRLFLLQAIVGAPLMEHFLPITLLDMISAPYTHITVSNLSFIDDAFNTLLDVHPDFPPIRQHFKILIEEWRETLSDIEYILSSEYDSMSESSLLDDQYEGEAVSDDDEENDKAEKHEAANILVGFSNHPATLFTSPTPPGDGVLLDKNSPGLKK